MTALWQGLVGLLLVFFLPGFAVARAVFPERRILRPFSSIALVESIALGLVLSVAITILVGFAWLGSSVGFQAGWSDPLVEATLAAVALVGFVVAYWRGSFARVPPVPATVEPNVPESDPIDLIRELERLHREERRIRHRLRTRTEGRADAERELEGVRSEIARLAAQREAEYGRA